MEVIHFLRLNREKAYFSGSGPLVILLVWVYYTSVIVLFGAELPRASLTCFKKPYKPNALAEWKETPAESA
jgi:uncharacterized BrkB/YihY/UPF0761 family membrane protein